MMKAKRQIQNLLDSMNVPVGNSINFLDPYRNENGWCLLYNGETIHINFNRHWLYFILPLFEASRAHTHTSLLQYLLNLCCRSFISKCSLDESGLVSIQLELPIVLLNRNYFQRAFEALNVSVKRYRDISVSEKDGIFINEPTNSPPAFPTDVDKWGKSVEIFPRETLMAFFKVVEYKGWFIKDRLNHIGLNHWHVVHNDGSRSYDVYLSFDRSWVYFQMPLLNEVYQENSHSHSYRELFFEFLLKLNQLVYWVKFGLDNDGQVLLMLDIPIENFKIDLFCSATETLANYAKDYSYEIQIMSTLEQDPDLSQLLIRNMKE